MKHTLGPWKIETDDLGCKTIVGNIKSDHSIGLEDRIFTVTEIGYTNGIPDEDEDSANARLIAAAPDYHEHAYNLGMLVLQSDLYQKDCDVRDEVDNILTIWRQVEDK